MSDLQWPETRIKKSYMDFFQDEDHKLWRSTTLFTDDGMNRPAFTDAAAYTELMELKKACYSQKFIRPGENYVDLEHVGVLDFPHTMYEILGNWSCEGDLRKDAIEWAWKLLTKVYGLSSDHICVTYFAGDEKAGLQPDNETRDLWLKFLPSQHILPFGYNDNFWEIGGTGPCGPCSGIHYDRIGKRDASNLVNNKEDITCVQIWNLVFIELDKENSGSYKPLASNHVDSKVKLESLSSILQGRLSSYSTDTYLQIYASIHEATGVDPCKGVESLLTEAYRAVADHMRTILFAIAAGYSMGSEGRSYALRRLFCRAVRYGMEFLKAEKGFFSGLVSSMVRVFPELEEQEEKIQKIIKDEETMVCEIMEHVLALKNPALRDKALSQLTRGELLKEEWEKDLAPLVRYSEDTVDHLLEDLTSTYNVQNHSFLLTWPRSNHLARILCLFNHLAEHPDTRPQFARARIHHYVYPFVDDKKTTEPVQFLRQAALEFLASYANVEDTNLLNALMYTGIVPRCLRVYWVGTLPAKQAVVSIVEKLLGNAVIINNITRDKMGRHDLVFGLMMMVGQLSVKELPVNILKTLIRCYVLLARHPRALQGKRRYIPPSLLNGTFARFIEDDPEYNSLSWLLLNLPRH